MGAVCLWIVCATFVTYVSSTTVCYECLHVEYKYATQETLDESSETVLSGVVSILDLQAVTDPQCMLHGSEFEQESPGMRICQFESQGCYQVVASIIFDNVLPGKHAPIVMRLFARGCTEGEVREDDCTQDWGAIYQADNPGYGTSCHCKDKFCNAGNREKWSSVLLWGMTGVVLMLTLVRYSLPSIQ